MASSNDPELPNGGRNQGHSAPPGGLISTAVRNNKGKIMTAIVIVIAVAMYFTQ